MFNPPSIFGWSNLKIWGHNQPDIVGLKKPILWFWNYIFIWFFQINYEVRIQSNQISCYAGKIFVLDTDYEVSKWKLINPFHWSCFRSGILQKLSSSKVVQVLSCFYSKHKNFQLKICKQNTKFGRLVVIWKLGLLNSCLLSTTEFWKVFAQHFSLI